MSNKIQIDNLYSVLEIVWMLTATVVKEESMEIEKKSVDQTNSWYLGKDEIVSTIQ